MRHVLSYRPGPASGRGTEHGRRESGQPARASVQQTARCAQRNRVGGLGRSKGSPKDAVGRMPTRSPPGRRHHRLDHAGPTARAVKMDTLASTRPAVSRPRTRPASGSTARGSPTGRGRGYPESCFEFPAEQHVQKQSRRLRPGSLARTCQSDLPRLGGHMLDARITSCTSHRLEAQLHDLRTPTKRPIAVWQCPRNRRTRVAAWVQLATLYRPLYLNLDYS